MNSLGNESRGSCRFAIRKKRHNVSDEVGKGLDCSGCILFPGWRQNTNSFVVSAKTMNPGLNENESEFGVFVLAVSLQVLPDGDSLIKCQLLGSLDRN